MKPFDIFMWQPPKWPEPHPAIVVSHPDRAARKDWVEVIACSSKRASRAAEVHEIILDEADGLDWPTLCKCDLIYAAPREDLKKLKGRVTPARQSLIVRKILETHGWSDVLRTSIL